MIKRSFIREILDAITPETISFAGGLPDPEGFPAQALAASAARVLAQGKGLQYARTQGDRELRERIAERYRAKGIPTDADEILITTGSQQAITLVSLAHLQEGVLSESPLYLGAKNVFEYFNVPITTFAMTRDGLDLEDLRSKAHSGGWAYLIPDFHNPTGYRYTMKEREEVADILDECGKGLIEDSAYEALYFDAPMPLLFTFLSGRHLHLGSFSKQLAPGLRVGWVRGSRELLAPMIAVKERIDLHTSSLDQAIIADYLAHNDLNAHNETLRHRYKGRMEVLAESLKTYLPQFEFRTPEGGMFIYGSLPGVDASELVKRCMAQGVVFVPGKEFGDTDAGSMRLNFTHADAESTRIGVQRLAKAAGL